MSTTSRRSASLATLTGSIMGTLIGSIRVIVLVPLYVHYIGPKLYGAWLGSGDILAWMHALDLGLSNLMIQRIGAAHGRNDSQSVGEWFATGTLVLGLMALLVLLIGAVTSLFLPGWMGLAGDEIQQLRGCFLVSIAATALMVFNYSFIGFSRGVQNTTFMNGVTVVSALTGLFTSLVLILTGRGLWAIAIGLTTQAVVSLVGSLFFVSQYVRGDIKPFFRARKAIFREFVVVAPVTALGSAGYAMMNQSLAALVAIFIRPEAAVIFGLTRKAADFARSLVDSIAFASYGGFAHLIGSDQRHLAWQVHAEIRSLRLSLSIALAAAYVAVNANFVSLWVGQDQYGGSWLTILIALQLIVVGDSFLVNYLYRASVSIVKGSIALFVEGVVRLLLMTGFLLWLGLPGGPAAAIITAIISAIIVYRWTIKEISSFSDPVHTFSGCVWSIRAAIFGVGLVTCLFLPKLSWISVLVIGSAIVIIGSLVLIYADPLLDKTRTSIIIMANRVKIIRSVASLTSEK